MSVTEEKKVLRGKMLALRRDMDFSDYRENCNAIYERVKGIKEFRRAGRVHCYVPSLQNEVDTLGIFYTMFDEGKTVVVPKCSSKKSELYHVRIRSLEELKPGRFGLMEPEYAAENIMQPASLDLVIAPLVAFDRSGKRLGMGGGYYDTFLKDVKCTVAGLAYSFQETDAVPTEAHDARLDVIITENEIIRVSHE